MDRARWKNAVCVIVVAGLLCPHVASADAQKDDAQAPPERQPIEALWREARQPSAQDLFNGPWGAAHAPDPGATYQFVRPKKRGTSPGFVVRDSSGRVWHVKQGREARPEVVASRILSAAGYHQPPVYFMPAFRLTGAGGRASSLTGGRFRLSTPGFTAGGSWMWDRNPFVETQPYRGLLVILVLLNAADLKTSNNRIYASTSPNGDRLWEYVVRDLGTTFGSTGRFDPPPNKLPVFERQPFITGVEDGFVTFEYGAVHNSLVHRAITVGDVHWACGRLAGLTDQQWDDAFRAGGYKPDVARRFIRRIQEKIAEGLSLR